MSELRLVFTLVPSECQPFSEIIVKTNRVWISLLDVHVRVHVQLLWRMTVWNCVMRSKGGEGWRAWLTSNYGVQTTSGDLKATQGFDKLRSKTKDSNRLLKNNTRCLLTWLKCVFY